MKKAEVKRMLELLETVRVEILELDIKDRETDDVFNELYRHIRKAKAALKASDE